MIPRIIVITLTVMDGSISQIVPAGSGIAVVRSVTAASLRRRLHVQPNISTGRLDIDLSCFPPLGSCMTVVVSIRMRHGRRSATNAAAEGF
jgi:hypothetical protein